MKRKQGILIAVVVACVGSAAARGADPVVPAGWPVAESKAYLSITPQAIVPETEQLVARLGAASFAVREAASKELKEKGTGAFPGLWEAAQKSGDAEVEARVRPYFRKEPYRIPGTAPAGFVAAIDEYLKFKAMKPSDREKEMRALRAFDLRLRSEENQVHLLNLLRAQETEDMLAKRILEDPGLACIRARLAIVEGKLDEAEAILKTDIGKGSSNRGAADYAAYVAMRRGAAFDPQKELDAANIQDEQTHNELGMWLFRANGDLKKAAEFGRALPFQVAGRSIKPTMVEAGEYREMAADIQANEKQERFLLIDVIALQLAGEERKAQQTLEGPLNDLNVAKAGSRENALRSLIRADQVEAAIGAARQKEDEQWMAAVLLCRQLRVGEALAAVKGQKHPPMELFDHLIDMGLASAARKVLVGIVPDEAALKDQAAAYESDLAALLDRVGEAAAADKWRARACELLDIDRKARVEAERPRNEALAKRRALEAVPESQRTDEWQRQFTVAQTELSRLNMQMVRATPWQSYSVRYYPQTTTVIEYQEAGSWMGYYAFMQNTTATAQERFRIMRGVFGGNYSGDELMKFIKLDPKDSSIEWELKMVTRSMQRIHREDLGRKLLEQDFAERRDPGSFSILGDWALAGNRAEEAVGWYRRAALLNLTDASLMYRLGVAYTRIPGKTEQGEQLKEFVPWLVLGHASDGEQVVAAMERFGDRGEVERMDGYLNRFAKTGSCDEMRPHLTRQRDAAEKRGDYARALVWAEQALLVPASNYSLGRDELILLAMEDRAAYERIRALDAWKRGDFGAAADALGRELENGPPDVEVLEKVVPGLKGAAREAAGKVVERARERLRAVVEAYSEAEVYQKELKRVEALR
jgi:hypothetical protein